jgi:hypothetical protein
MDKKCMNCKSFNSGTCFNSDFIKSINIDISNNIYNIFESGKLAEFLQENIDFEYISNLHIELLKKNDFLKKNKNTNNFNNEDIQANIIEELDDKISNFLIRNIKSIKPFVKIDPSFNCMFWE